jgi:hypothetical protein
LAGVFQPLESNDLSMRMKSRLPTGARDHGNGLAARVPHIA